MLHTVQKYRQDARLRYAIDVLQVALPALCVACAFRNEGISLRYVGDILQIAIPAFGLVIGLYSKDREGLEEWLKCTIVTSALSHAAKFIFNYTSLGERPNGKYGSFPSAHTSSAVSGASFLGMRYGWELGIPGLLLALVTGYSRVEAQQHHWHDVIVGSILAFAVSYYFTQRYERV